MLGVVLAGALSGVGCSSSSTSPTVSEAPEPSTTTIAEVTSDDVGTTSWAQPPRQLVTTTSVVVDETEERLIAVIDNYLASTKAPGVTMTVLRPSDDGTDAIEAISLAQGGALRLKLKSRHLTISGGRQLQTNDPIVVLQLVEEGLIDLDATVSTYLAKVGLRATNSTGLITATPSPSVRFSITPTVSPSSRSTSVFVLEHSTRHPIRTGGSH